MGCPDCDSITLPIPEDGVGIASVTLNGSNQLVITYTDGSTTTTSAITVTDSGSAILYNNLTSETTDVVTPGVPVIIGTKTYTVPAATLTTDGSEIRARAILQQTVTNSDLNNVATFFINGVSYHSSATAGLIGFSSSTYYVDMEIIITRKSNTTASVAFTANVYNVKYGLVPSLSKGIVYIDNATIGTVDFTTTGLVIAVYGSGSGSTDVNLTCDKFEVEYIKK